MRLGTPPCEPDHGRAGSVGRRRARGLHGGTGCVPGLEDLRPGAAIHIERSDGSTATWASERSEQTDKDDLPVASICNRTDEPVLRLITCGGAFDRSIGHYTDNVIVYAAPRSSSWGPGHPHHGAARPGGHRYVGLSAAPSRLLD